MNSPREVHQHRFLPSKGCSWACVCGASFIACICGRCPKPEPKFIEQSDLKPDDELKVKLLVPEVKVTVHLRGMRKS